MQTVSKTDNPWLYGLLRQVKALMGYAVLVNTSLNEKGRPILNTIRDALALLEKHIDFGGLLVEDFWFTKTVRTDSHSD